MAKKASSGKAEFWTAAIELFSESTLSCREFCEREGLSYSTFCRWQERLTNKVDANAPAVNSNNLPKESGADKLGQVGMSSKSGQPGKSRRSGRPGDYVESGGNGKSGYSAKGMKFVSAGVIVAGGDEKAGIEIRFSSGISIDLCQKFDRVAFKDVISILGAELC